MAHGRILLLLALTLFSTLALADGTKSSGSGNSSNNSSSSKNAFVIVEASGGTSFLSQYMANDNIEHPPAYRFAGRWHRSIFHLGISYLALAHKDNVGQNPPGVAPNVNEIDNEEDFNLTSLNAGFVFGNWLLLDAGYGIANFKRTQVLPWAASPTSQSYTASGLGWMAGGSLVPIHVGQFSLGLTGYYFDATASDYSSDVFNAGTETLKATGNGSVHSFGWFAGLTFFFGL